MDGHGNCAESFCGHSEYIHQLFHGNTKEILLKRQCYWARRLTFIFIFVAPVNEYEN